MLPARNRRKGEADTDLAEGFPIGTTTVYRYLREGLVLVYGPDV